MSVGVSAQVTPKWIRYASISPDGQNIVFTYKGDLFRVSSEGGDATQLTFHKAHDYNAVWSHDGQQLAFASDRHGNFDVYVMDALGGSAKRLTYHSTDEIPSTFSPDNNSVYFTGHRMDTKEHREFPSSRFAEVYAVPATGGKISQVFTTTAENISISKDGTTLIYEDFKGRENYWRKHHTSAVTRDIWRYDIKAQSHEQLTRFKGEDRDPAFSQDEDDIYYLSEESGTFNVHRLDLSRPKSTKQITDFKLHPVRFLSQGGGKLAFTYHGELYTMTEGEKPKKLSVNIRTQDIDNSFELASVNGDISELAISPDGKQIAFIANGDVFVSAKDGAFTKQITKTPETEAFVSFTDDADGVIYASERNGNWGIYKTEKARESEPFFYASTVLKESEVLVGDKDYTQPLVSPDGEKMAFIEDRRTLRVMSLDSNKATTLVPSKEMYTFRAGDKTFSWSPDSQWLVFEHEKLLNNSDVAIVKADGSEKFKVLIPSGYSDSSPKWANEGKQILWFSNRDGMRSYATSGRTQQDVYALFLTQDAWDEYRLSEDDYELMQALDEINEENEKEQQEAEEKPEDEQDEDKKDEEEKVDPIEIDWDGLQERTAKLTIHSSRLSDAVLNKDADTLYYLTRFEGRLDLWKTNLRTQETEKAVSLNKNYASLHWDPKMENLYLLADGGISEVDLDKGRAKPVSINAQMEMDEEAIMQSSFDHVWLRTSKIFYEPSFHGIDWQKMYSEYKPLVSHVGNGYEFTELLSEMIGELNVSHAGAGYSSSMRDGDSTAALGIFYDHSDYSDGILITEVIKGGPLDKAKFDITAGMRITAINGETITNDMDWSKLLNRQADKFVLLGLKTASGETKEYTVKPISLYEQQDLLYDRFVKINEKEVLEKSKGTLGYVHIPGMSDGPYRNVFDVMLGKHFDKKAMVVDTRNNGGGDLVADLAMFFTGEKFLTYATEERVVGGEPTSRYTKPIITLFNPSMYSDGHCYASGYTDLKLGKSVGTPVPGTCSFAGWEGLPLGGYWGVVPISAKNKKGEWLENNQTEPDILVVNEPEVISAGRDQQLERAIKELLKDVR